MTDQAPVLNWETIDAEAFYPDPRYAAVDGYDRYEIHYNAKEHRWVLFQNGEAWRSTGGAPWRSPAHPATAANPATLDAAKAMAEEWAR
jgi:hypothetical protein